MVVLSKRINLSEHTREDDFVFDIPPNKENRVINKEDGTVRQRGEWTQAEEDKMAAQKMAKQKNAE